MRAMAWTVWVVVAAGCWSSEPVQYGADGGAADGDTPPGADGGDCQPRLVDGERLCACTWDESTWGRCYWADELIQ
ncbi:MAG: hypothetical protein R3F60_14710 [bacterium]